MVHLQSFHVSVSLSAAAHAAPPQDAPVVGKAILRPPCVIWLVGEDERGGAADDEGAKAAAADGGGD